MTTAAHLEHAQNFLLKEIEPIVQRKNLTEYKSDIDNSEYELIMYELESLALEHGAKPSFWNCLEKAAILMELPVKAKEYRVKFETAHIKKNI